MEGSEEGRLLEKGFVSNDDLAALCASDAEIDLPFLYTWGTASLVYIFLCPYVSVVNF